MATRLPAFKAYDIRGKVPEQLNEQIAYKIGRAYAAEIRPQAPVIIGRDIRRSSDALAAAVTQGLNDSGVSTVDIGVCGTEMVYFGASRAGFGGGIMVTASHNPMQYNGLKLVSAGAVPISGDSGLDAIEQRVRSETFAPPSATPGSAVSADILADFIDCVLNFVAQSELKPLRIVVNPGNGCAGAAVAALSAKLPFEIIRVNFEPDGNFPNGIPNPLLEENRPATRDAVLANRADLGIAWDGDYDRCFFFDEHGKFIDGYYLVGLFASEMLQHAPGSRIIHDPRLIWNSQDMIAAAGGVAVQSKTGHAFIKERMRAENALYGGEVSAHHYFRDFAYCDSGMIPWLLLTAMLSKSGKPASALIAERKARYPISGEINRIVDDADAAIARVRRSYAASVSEIDETDGISMAFGHDWRFNLRCSQTEPILRLNIETHADAQLLASKTAELLQMIEA